MNLSKQYCFEVQCIHDTTSIGIFQSQDLNLWLSGCDAEFWMDELWIWGKNLWRASSSDWWMFSTEPGPSAISQSPRYSSTSNILQTFLGCDEFSLETIKLPWQISPGNENIEEYFWKKRGEIRSRLSKYILVLRGGNWLWKLSRGYARYPNITNSARLETEYKDLQANEKVNKTQAICPPYQRDNLK